MRRGVHVQKLLQEVVLQANLRQGRPELRQGQDHAPTNAGVGVTVVVYYNREELKQPM